ncbi:MAG TPA: ANTAR domain-containing protein [Bacillota bacterium]
MNGLRVVTLGLDTTKQPSPPHAVLQTGWTVLEAPQGLPTAGWLREQRVDVVVVRGGGPAAAWAALLAAARAAGCGVVWAVKEGGGEGAESEDFPARLAAARWPLWACVPDDAPVWLWVAVCRSLAEAARREADLRSRVERLSRQLEDRKVIERAKGILMDRFDLSESEAYRRMRETAMRQRKSLREIAQAVVAFDEGD